MSCTVLFSGGVASEVRTRQLPGGQSVAEFLAVIPRWTKAGEKKDFVRVTVWGSSGAACAKYLRKGSKVAVVGRLSGEFYEKDGKRVLSPAQVVAEHVEFLTPAPQGQTTESYAANPAPGRGGKAAA
ncbi:MAG TPA: single-stranded DNA-binding protein [Candidatus Dormibacteraeota bacterium]|jgi:single-strand DNA-binding protein|nr:single-stranded DNA-binding protein [Candidatus Dormibacteraeota bacterium]